MPEGKKRFAMFIPSATVFIASGCIMTLELVGGRLVARDLGASLYTWTSIIGVVLLGISIGNYTGGILADRCHGRKTLGLLFALAAAACVLTIGCNNAVGQINWLIKLNWPTRVAAHIAIVFLVPSIILGTISPIIAKRALELGLATGRTIGDLYAIGAIGSIVGTFLTGFYLIAEFGTIETIWGIGVVLTVMGLLYAPRSWLIYLWTVIFAVLLILAFSKASWAETFISKLALKRNADKNILFETESQYSYLSVRQLYSVPDIRSISVNNDFARNRINMDEPLSLVDPYMKIYAAVTARFYPVTKPLTALVIGGGGYIFPRYMEQTWPGSRIDAVEIDPQVTAAAVAGLGLDPDTALNIIAMDARNYVDQTLAGGEAGQARKRYDVVYGDAFSDFAVPFQLVTREFNEKLVRLLSDEGIYLLNMIDVYDSGQFLGALIQTIRQSFVSCHVVCQRAPHGNCNSFVIIAGKIPLSLDGLHEHEQLKRLHLDILSPEQLDELVAKADEMILTDNYVPVENLLAPAVVRAFHHRNAH